MTRREPGWHDRDVILIRGGTVVSAGTARRADVIVHGDRVAAVGLETRGGDVLARSGAEVFDATGCYVSPGFVDVQVNGGWGVDLLSDPGSWPRVAAGLARHGVTSWCPTVVSATNERRHRALAALGGACDPGPGHARSLGVHLEGPFLSPERRGAHSPSAVVDPDLAEAMTWPARGVRLVTLAPERPGARAVTRMLVDAGVTVAAGHTDASAEEFAAGVAAGIRGVTHLFNAMRPFGHRDPGPVGAALNDDRVTCGLIADGIHVDPLAVRLAWQVLGPHRLCLVSDAVAVLGVPGGRSRLGGVELVATAAGVRGPGGTLAGTDLTLDRAVRNLWRWTGAAVAEVVACATSTPARLMGRDDVGVLRAGAMADVVVLDEALEVKATMVRGSWLDATAPMTAAPAGDANMES